MTRATFNVLFYIKRTKELKDGTVPIFARVTVNRQRAEFGLQQRIKADAWDPVRGCAIGLTKTAKETNAYLDLVKADLLFSKRELEEQGKPVTAHILKNSYLGIENESRTILEVFREHNDKCKQLKNIDFAPGTVERYITCCKHVESFIKLKYKRDDLPLHEITPAFISGLELYLMTTCKCCHNTATKYLKNFKKITRIARANDWMKSDPFANIKFHLDEVDMDYRDMQKIYVKYDRVLAN